MAELLQRLKQRKLVQWALAYAAGAWVVLQVLSLMSGTYHWPDVVMQVSFGIVLLGFVVAIVLAWYHGERGVQRVIGSELAILAVLLAIGGALLWHFTGTSKSSAPAIAAAATDASARKAPPAVAAIAATSASRTP